MGEEQISVQRLMDRFRYAALDLFDRHFDDDFVAERFGWVEQAMFLVMVLNYFDLKEAKAIYPELAISPVDGAQVGVQNDGRITTLVEGDLLHFRYFVDETLGRRDMAFAVASVVKTADPALLGKDITIDYKDCRFLGAVAAID